MPKILKHVSFTTYIYQIVSSLIMLVLTGCDRFIAGVFDLFSVPPRNRNPEIREATWILISLRKFCVDTTHLGDHRLALVSRVN
jgi:hypothetical protein